VRKIDTWLDAIVALVAIVAATVMFRGYYQAMTWIMARRLFQNQVVSVVAASVAVIYALASPSLRLLATDVMLECLGSALTALSVYRTRGLTPTPHATTWRLLAVTLTLLFFEKYNHENAKALIEDATGIPEGKRGFGWVALCLSRIRYPPRLQKE
jgi:hypothetical protein